MLGRGVGARAIPEGKTHQGDLIHPMASKLATAGDAKSGHAGPAKTPEVASLALPRPGCIGWVVV